MDKEVPKIGWIVEHYFLWADEDEAGRTEGRKPRPCIIIAVEEEAPGRQRITVLPISTSPPPPGTPSLPIPDVLKAALGLDPARPSWVVVKDANVFTWPGYDLVPRPDGRFKRGMVTAGFFRQLCKLVLDVRSSDAPRLVERDDCQ